MKGHRGPGFPHRATPAVTVVVALAVIGVACGGGSAPSGSTGSSGTAVSLPASPTELPEFDPASFHQLLDSLHGTPVVVNVWASWCGPCIVEAPHLATVSAAFEGKVQFIGVDVQDQRGPARSFIQRYGWSYPSVFDPSGKIRDSLGFVGQPVTVIFDASGARTRVFPGATQEQTLSEALADVTAGSSP